ncbi:unnamed protein product, partial [Effrenium voratum]
QLRQGVPMDQYRECNLCCGPLTGDNKSPGLMSRSQRLNMDGAVATERVKRIGMLGYVPLNMEDRRSFKQQMEAKVTGGQRFLQLPPEYSEVKLVQDFQQFAENPEKEDLFMFIKYNERTGTALSINQIQDAINLMKLQKQGALDGGVPGDLLEQLEALRPKHYHLWSDFRAWVQKRKPAAEHLNLSRLKTKSVQEITSCTPKVVRQIFDDLERMCTDAGILHDGILQPEASGRLCVTDEKGFSGRSDSIVRGVTTRQGRQTAATTVALPSFEHVTVTSFLPVTGDPLPCGVIVEKLSISEGFLRAGPLDQIAQTFQLRLEWEKQQ